MSAAGGARRRVRGSRGSAAQAKRATLEAETGTGRGGSRCLDALCVAVSQTPDTMQWYTVAKELQLASLQLCEACRGVHIFHLRVENGFPTSLLTAVHGPRANPGEGSSSRVPLLRARHVRWELPSVDLLREFVEPWAGVEKLVFGDAFDGSLEGCAWPRCLRVVKFRKFSLFVQPIAGVAWPASLHHLIFGFKFDQAIEGVTWPTSLQTLSIHNDFNQPIEGTTWPTSLQVLKFDFRFNQPIERAALPSSLLRLTFGGMFNQPIERVEWPEALQQLTFGSSFDQPIGGVTWPPSLQRLTFGWSFDQPIDYVVWPTSLLQLAFGSEFNRPIGGGAFPSSLVELSFQGRFNFSIGGLTLPRSLERLTLACRFNQPVAGVTWPPSLQQLTFGSDFNQPICGVAWPKSLQQLSLGTCFNQPVDDFLWPPTLEELTFGTEFNQVLHGVKWPSLRRLTLKGSFAQSLRKIGTAMPALERLTLHLWRDSTNYRILRGVEWPVSLSHLAVRDGASLDGVCIPPHIWLSYDRVAL